MRHFILTTALCLANPLLAEVPRPATLSDTLALLHEAMIDAGFVDAAIDAENQSVISDPAATDSYVSYPDNLHRSLQTARDDAARQLVLDDFMLAFVSAQRQINDDFVADQVMPVLRHVDYLDGVSGDPDIVTRPFVGDLMIAYVVDYPTHTTSISAEIMADTGYDATGLHALALQNLTSRSEALGVEGSDLGIYFLTLDGYYENALLLDPGLWDDISGQIGPIAVAVPARDLVLIAARDNKPALQVMSEIRDEVLRDNPYTLSKMMFKWEDGRWDMLDD